MALPSIEAFHDLITSSVLSLEHKDAFFTWSAIAQTRLQQPTKSSDFLDILDSIPSPPGCGTLSLASLSFVLSQSQGSLPSFDIIRCYTKLWLSLPETSKAGQDEALKAIRQDVHDRLCRSVGTAPSHFTSNANTMALIDPDTRRFLTHRQISDFIQAFALPISVTSNSTVAIALPQGYSFALACLAVSSYYTAAPLNISGGSAQFRSEIELSGAQSVLVLATDVERLGLQDPWVVEGGIEIILATPKEDMTFEVQALSSLPPTNIVPPTPNSGEDLALMLFTSGTSGTRKVVPVTCLGLLTGVQCVIDSWHLTPTDSCVNMMPLNHVGGIVRNLFAPVLSGGSTIICPAFDPNLFWDLLEAGQGTWYYASPSMHMSILAEAGMRGDSVEKCQLRLVCNAAGGLLPALAARLKDTFSCTVLPSYGMTECMPISTPPINYTLDRIGTSGIGCGPEIAILDDSGNPLNVGEVGRINVRGGPTFPGYLLNGKIDKSAFSSNGWFDTGDLGSLDQDGYLYLTGRGKEVINRGGEIISPFEVEEAITIASQDRKSTLFERIHQVLAFSAPHEVLQEVVGVALVTAGHSRRSDLRDLHAALKLSLHHAKLPMVLVYMDALPTSNNKLVRIRFAERMGMKPIANDTSLTKRHFDAICPPLNSALSTKIANSTCELDLSQLLSQLQELAGSQLQAHVGISHHDGTPVAYLAPSEANEPQTLDESVIEDLKEKLRKALDGLLIPSSISFLPQPYPRLPNQTIDEHALEDMLAAIKHAQSSPAASETEERIRKAFAEVLNFPEDEINSNSDFFALGGESLSAGQLLSLIRRDIGVRIPVDKLFTSPTVSSLCTLAEEILQANANLDQQSATTSTSIPWCTETYTSTNPLVLIVHALPIVLFYPMKMAFQWIALMYALSTLSQDWIESNIAARFLALIASMFVSRFATQILAPFFGIVFKWVVIGRYREGMYPMWGPYHTRWWIVDKVLRICGKGHFRHFESTRILYYRLLGARIGSNVTIEKGTTIGEYDLLTIGDNAHLDRCIVRPFAAERNTSMYLGPINIGSNSSIGLKSHIAAGATLPPDTFIGPNSSSYEIDTKDSSDFQPPPKSNFWIQIFCILPIQVFVVFISSLPWMGGLFGIVINEPGGKAGDTVRGIITWWATPHRIEYHYLAQALHVSVRPFVWFALVVIIKYLLNFFCGRATPKLEGERTQKDRFRKQLLTSLVPHGSLKSITKLFGAHYESTSIAVRALGGKVGKRVYWPGTGPSIEDFDLIDIGDDVVFGSRSHLVTSDATGSDMIRIGNGAMIADRVVLSRGAQIGNRTVLGSGAFINRHQRCAPDSVWVGNRNGSAVCLSNSNSESSSMTDVEKGIVSYAASSHDMSISTPSYPGSLKSPMGYSSDLDEICNGKDISKATVGSSSSTLTSSSENLPSTPFGRAFYARQAPYFVFSQFTIFLYSTFITIFVQIYWNVATISTVILAHIINNTDQFHPRWYRPLKIYAFDVCIVSALCICLAILSLAVCIAAKWILLGRRKPGSYDWDKSSYCQRWQLFLTIEALRRRCFGGNGVLGMLTGSWYISLYFRLQGASIGPNCALFAGGRPSLVFTEPDLLTLGERVSVDDASLVGHVNSRGKFSLNRLEVGDRSVLRSGSRLLSGARMGMESVLLEHTLIMAGDEADDGAVYQGWPAERVA